MFQVFLKASRIFDLKKMHSVVWCFIFFKFTLSNAQCAVTLKSQSFIAFINQLLISYFVFLK